MATFQEQIIVMIKAMSNQFHTVMNKSRKALDGMGVGIEKAGFAMRRTVTSAKRFKMELLGVMFFGMMLRNTFSQMLQPIMDAYGIMEIWSQMLLTLFLPVMDAIFPYLLSFMEWFMNLPDSIKTLIGIFVLFMIGIGQVLYLFGALGLALNSLLIAFSGPLGGAITGIGTALVELGAIAGILFGVIIAIVIGFVIAWKENFGQIREWVMVMWEGIKGMFKGGFEFIKGLLKVFISIFKGDFSGVKEGIGMMINGVKTMFEGLFKFILGLLVTLGLSILRIIYGIGKTFYDAGKWIVEQIGKGIESLAIWLIHTIEKLFPSWLIGFLKKGGTFALNLLGGGSPIPSHDDFIWRSGQGAIGINPNDNIVGFKGSNPMSSGVAASINAVYNINVLDRSELERLLREHDKKLVDDVRRIVKQ
jgi:hypothetical protein